MAEPITNSTQVQTTTAALVAGAAGFAAGHGWLGLDAGTWGVLFSALAVFVPAAWPAIVTRATSLKNTVGGMKGTTVITDAVSAAALPNNPDVVAATPAIVAAINSAK
jgi:hypothetical protein